jgi:hypothetical protein
MTITEFLTQYQVLFLTLHILGVALGLGGATIADTFFFRFLSDFRISRKEADTMQWMSKLIVAALVLIYVSGGAIYMIDPNRYLASAPFLFKMIIVFVVTVNGISLHEFISPRLVHLSFLSLRPNANATAHRLRRIAFAMGAVSMTSWYTVFFTAMLKTLISEAVALRHLLLLYIAALAVAIFCSQVLERHLHRRSSSL